MATAATMAADGQTLPAAALINFVSSLPESSEPAPRCQVCQVPTRKALSYLEELGAPSGCKKGGFLGPCRPPGDGRVRPGGMCPIHKARRRDKPRDPRRPARARSRRPALAVRWKRQPAG